MCSLGGGLCSPSARVFHESRQFLYTIHLSLQRFQKFSCHSCHSFGSCKRLVTFWLAMQLWAEAEAVVGVKLRAGAGSEPRLTLSSGDAGIQGCVRGHGFMREILTVTTQPECKSWEPVMYRVTAITHAWVLNC